MDLSGTEYTLLLAALNELSEGFALYDEDDRFVLCNQQYREVNEPEAAFLVPGTLFEDALKANIAVTSIPLGFQNKQQWYENRMSWHRNSLTSSEIELQDGRWILIREVKVTNGGTVVFNTDITNKKHTQQVLEDSEALLNQGAAMANIGYAIWSYVEEKYISFSEEYARIQGYSMDEFETVFTNLESDLAPIHPEDRDRYLEYYYSPDKGTAEIEYRMFLTDGSMRLMYECYQSTLDIYGARVQALVSIQDVTESRRTQKALEDSETMLAQGAMMANIGYATWDYKMQQYTTVSEVYARIHGYTVTQFLTQMNSLDQDNKLIHPDDLKKCQQFYELQDTESEIEYRVISKDGAIRFVHERYKDIVDDSGVRIQSLVVIQDISERKMVEDALSYQASHDALTKLMSRSEFENYLERVVNNTRQTDHQHALCFMDLDRFKVINDTCGHIAGDELLKQLAMLLTDNMEDRFTLARLGGDEFGIVMEQCSLDEAQHHANKIRQVVEGYIFLWEKRVFRIGASIGLVPITHASESFTNLLIAADTACYAAKDSGRNRVNVYQINDKHFNRRQFEMMQLAQLNSALDEDRFQLWYQPIVSINDFSETQKSYELLLRMFDEQGELVLPGIFFPIAEQFGLSNKLDRWVIKTAFSWLNDFPQLVSDTHLCFINLSGSSLADEDFLEFVQHCFQTFAVPEQKICFEVTETEAITNLARAIIFMNSLKEQGCSFALDDFGSGLSSFTYLKTLPVDYLKIDGTFVKEISQSDVDMAVVRSINDVGKAMDKKIIAEFVETPELFRKVREIGVDYVQGYALGHPEPIDNFSVK